MKSLFYLAILCFFMAPALLRAQQGAKADIEISSAVLKTAEWAGFPYMETIDKAQSGDIDAIRKFFEFSGTVDGVEALQHAVTCLELSALLADDRVGWAITRLKPRLKTVLLERFQIAQSRTKKEALHKPMQQWAPGIWKALNGEEVLCHSCSEGGSISKPDAAKAEMKAMKDSQSKQQPQTPPAADSQHKE